MKHLVIIASLLISSYAYTYTLDKDWTTIDPCCEEKDGIIYDAKTGELYTGVVEVHDELGRLKETTPFKDGKRHGVYESFDCHGSGRNPKCQLANRINYKNGKRHGLTEHFDAYFGDGHLTQRGIFKEGKSNGLFEWFDAKGNLRQRETHKDDKTLLRRLHVKEDNHVSGGAKAFLLLWKRIPKYKFLYYFFKMPIIFNLFSIGCEIIAYFLYLKNKKQLIKNN